MSVTGKEDGPGETAMPAKVLIVEDTPIVAMTISTMLLELGIEEVTIAQSVEQGLSSLEDTRFHLAIVDLQLGDQNGLVVAERCADLKIPVIYSTGHGPVMVPVVYPGEAFLQKPYTLSQLKGAIEALCGQHG